MAADAVESLRPVAESKSVELRLDSVGTSVVRADGPRLRQLLDNLVSNAVKFTPEGGNVVVALERCDDDLVLAVSDTGSGILADEQRRLFDRLFRSSSAQKQAIDGTGLGLTIARAIAEAHAGTIGFSSVENKGTTFEVRLPEAGPPARTAALEAQTAHSGRAA